MLRMLACGWYWSFHAGIGNECIGRSQSHVRCSKPDWKSYPQSKPEEIEIEGADEENTSEAENTEKEATAENTAKAETSDEEADDADPADKDEKKGLFKKKKKDKKDEQIEELNDRLKRQMAEFENFRKRTEKEKTQMFDMGAKRSNPDRRR